MRISTVGLMVLGVVFRVQGQDAGKQGASPAPSTSYFGTEWLFEKKPVYSQETNIRYTYTDNGAIANKTWMALCQTNATTLPLNGSNTWPITLMPSCPRGSWTCGQEIDSDGKSKYGQNFSYVPKEVKAQGRSSKNFFFCFGIVPGSNIEIPDPNAPLDNMVCESYSPFFDIGGGQEQPPPSASPSLPITTPAPTAGVGKVRRQTPGTWFSNGLAASPPDNVQSITSVVLSLTSLGSVPTSSAVVTVSQSPTATVTVPPSSDTSNAKPASPSKGGLSLGAKIGIGLGALGFVLIILLFALFCLRRRHAKRSISRSEQVMLTQSVHNESRDLVTEKEIATGATLHDTDHDNDTDSGPPVLPLPTTRHSALSPYETLPSQPYSGSAAAIPRRKPGSAPTSAGSDTLTRAVSTISDRTIDIPAATRASNEHHFEQYHDVPIYSTARAFQGSFLESEDGHSATAATASEEEARRLEEARLEEEEERRIDAAIAEAERARGPLR